MKFFVYTVVCLVLFVGWSEAHEAPADTVKSVAAVRVNPHPPRLDGLLNDPIWKIAPKTSGFRQNRPNEGELATERTTIQVCYEKVSPGGYLGLGM